MLSHVQLRGNRATATGVSGSAHGGGLWNGEIFGIPTAPPTLDHTRVSGNVLRGSAGVDLQGGGVFTPGFPAVLIDSEVTCTVPDDCVGC